MEKKTWWETPMKNDLDSLNLQKYQPDEPDDRETLYFAYYINVAGLSRQKAREHIIEVVDQMGTPSKRDQYREKWFFVPITDGQTRIELLYAKHK